MPLDFPNSPAIGATYSPAGVSKSWIYTGEQWSAITAPIEEGASVTVSDTPPSGASAGDLWFDSSSGVTSVYYDGTWVDVGGGDSGTSAGSVNGIVQCDGNGNFSAAVAGTDYLTSANFTGTNQSFTSTGHQKLPGGLIINWGSVGLTDQSSQIITYSMAFPTAILSVAAVAVTQNQDNWATVLIDYTGTNSRTRIQLQREGNGVAGGSNGCFFIAIGY